MEKLSSTVGIGLPVYNNEKYLTRVLDSLLNQTYKNIVIYLSDDCSTDATESICLQYQKQDKRVIYSRNQTNIGANANNKKVLQMATTEYFMFSRGHEMLSENLVEDCLNILVNESGAVLSFCTTKWIDEDDQVVANKPIGYFDTTGFDVVTRCAVALWGNWDCYYGLSKTSILKSIRANEAIIGNDTLSLFEKALIGGFAHARTGLRYRRYIYHGETYKKRMKRYRKTTHKNLKLLSRLFPLAQLPFLLFTSVLKAKVTILQKVLIFLLIIFNAPIRYIVSKGNAL